MSQKYVSKQAIEQAANGRWQAVLERAGVPAQLLTRKHQPCPDCGGENRFRFTDYQGTGVWICNQCQPDGASPFDLVMAVFGCSFVAAKNLLADALGLSAGTAPDMVAKDLPAPAKKTTVRDEYTPIVPVPDFAVKSMNWHHKYRKDAPVDTSIFRSANGEILGGVARFVRSDGSKLDLPYTFCRHKDGSMSWQYRCWDNPRPLFGLDALAAHPDKTVLVVEGEKCKKAADAADLGVVAVTWHGGVNNWDKSDWTPIRNRRVILWADADSKREKLSKKERDAGVSPESKPYLPKHEQGGMKAMMGIAERLTEQGCDVCFVALPDVGVLPDGYDIADALAERAPQLPVRDILSWQGAADWLVDYAQVQRVSVPSQTMSVCAAETDSFTETTETAHTQPDGTFAGQVSSAKSEKAAAQNLIENLLQNYALIGMKERAIHLQTGETLSRRQLEKIFGKDAVLNWLYHKNKKTVREFEAEILSKKRKLEMLAQNDDFSQVLDRYIYLDGTTDAYDVKLDTVISLAAVKAAIPEAFDDWAKSPRRYVCPMQNYVFDPQLPPGISYQETEQETEQKNEQETEQKTEADHPNHRKPIAYINNFKGFDIDFEQTEPAPPETTLDELYKQHPDCRQIISLIWHLCSGNGTRSKDVLEWVLNWIACRLRQPHIKPATSLVFISEIQGVGKSTFGEKILKGLFTRYCRQLDQNALESRFNSSLLFALITIFEEISPSDERMNIIGKLKNMITSDVIMVERKGRDAEKFADYNSFVIFSNDPRSIPIESNDRRFMVSYCDKKYTDEQYEALQKELDKDGLTAFAEFLHALPLRYTGEDGTRRDFSPHSKPLITPIKRRMISLNKASWEAFLDDLRNGDIGGLPFVSVASKDLWAVYVYWCAYTGTFKMTQKNFFASVASQYQSDYRTPCHIDGGTKNLRIFTVPHDKLDASKYPPPNTHQTSREGTNARRITTAEYYGKQVMAFHAAAKRLIQSLPDL